MRRRLLFSTASGSSLVNNIFGSHIWQTCPHLNRNWTYMRFSAAAKTFPSPLPPFPSYSQKYDAIANYDALANEIESSNVSEFAQETENDEELEAVLLGESQECKDKEGQQAGDVDVASQVQRARVKLAENRAKLDLDPEHPGSDKQMKGVPMELHGRTASFLKKFGLSAMNLNWFPGHMALAVKALREQIKSIDLVLEVRDARVPFSSANPTLDDVIGSRKRLVVLNKADLLPGGPSIKKKIGEGLRLAGHPYIFVSANTTSNKTRQSGTSTSMIRQLRMKIDDLLERKFRSVNANVLVVGYPNVGKSSIINALRYSSNNTDSKEQQTQPGAKMAKATRGKRSGAKTGALPGVTQHISSFRIADNPPIMVVDSPGIMTPSFDQQPHMREVALKLALTGMIKDRIVGEELLATYCLWHLNETKSFKYVEVFHLHAPVGDIKDFLHHVACRMTPHKTSPREEYLTRATRFFLLQFRSGTLGPQIMDEL